MVGNFCFGSMRSFIAFKREFFYDNSPRHLSVGCLVARFLLAFDVLCRLAVSPLLNVVCLSKSNEVWLKKEIALDGIFVFLSRVACLTHSLLDASCYALIPRDFRSVNFVRLLGTHVASRVPRQKVTPKTFHCLLGEGDDEVEERRRRRWKIVISHTRTARIRPIDWGMKRASPSSSCRRRDWNAKKAEKGSSRQAAQSRLPEHWNLRNCENLLCIPPGLGARVRLVRRSVMAGRNASSSSKPVGGSGRKTKRKAKTAKSAEHLEKLFSPSLSLPHTRLLFLRCQQMFHYIINIF